MSVSIIGKHATPATGTPIASDSLLTVVCRMAKRQMNQIAARRRMRRDVELLLAMDDRMLADIGLRRWEVEYAARYGRRPVDRSTGDDR